MVWQALVAIKKARESELLMGVMVNWNLTPINRPLLTFGLDVVTDLCEQLRAGGAPGLHFYSMNQSVATLEICGRLASR